MTNKIIGLAGSHGTGKSTLLRDISESGVIHIDETQLSRTAQARLGWDRLSRAEESISNMWSLQDAILQSMFDRDQAIIQSGKITLVDRTPADVWAYTKLWLSRHGVDAQHDPTARTYKALCRVLAQNYAMFIYIPVSPNIPFVEELNRADKASQLDVASTIEDFIWDGALPVYPIKSSDRVQRVAEVMSQITIQKAKNGN